MRLSTTAEITQAPTMAQRIFDTLKKVTGEVASTVREGGEGLANFFRGKAGLVLAGALAVGTVGGCDSKDNPKTTSSSTSEAGGTSSGDSISSTSVPRETDSDPTSGTGGMSSTGETGSATINDTSTTDPTTGNVSATDTTTTTPNGCEGVRCTNGTCEGEGQCVCNDPCYVGGNQDCYTNCARGCINITPDSPNPTCVENPEAPGPFSISDKLPDAIGQPYTIYGGVGTPEKTEKAFWINLDDAIPIATQCPDYVPNDPEYICDLQFDADQLGNAQKICTFGESMNGTEGIMDDKSCRVFYPI